MQTLVTRGIVHPEMAIRRLTPFFFAMLLPIAGCSCGGNNGNGGDAGPIDGATGLDGATGTDGSTGADGSAGGDGGNQLDGGVVIIPTDGGTRVCTRIVCGASGEIEECGDCMDNDSDGIYDMEDPECLSPCDQVEAS